MEDQSEPSDGSVAPDPARHARVARIGPAKYTRPRSPESIVARERLYRMMDSAITHPLTLVVGPAGYGKSTLVSAWLARGGLPAAWFFADEHDADPTVFMRSLIESVARVAPEAIPRSMPLLSNPHASFQFLMVELVEDLAQAQPPFVIVIDDYHRCQTSEIDGLLALLLRSIGAAPSLCVISRTRPGLPLDVLHAYGEVDAIGIGELRFSETEARSLLQRTSTGSLSSGTIDSIVIRADGWPVGLKLLANAAQATGQGQMLPALPGTPQTGPEIGSYLFAEVIGMQSASVQEFLVRTALLEFLRPEYCSKLTGYSDSDALLRRLFEQELFIELIERDTPTYRYHPLFREALLERLEATHSTRQIEELHRTAANCHAAHGELEWAARHRMQASDWDDALALVHRQAAGWMLDDQLASLETWTGRFPLDTLLRDPFLTFCRGWSLARLGRSTDADRLLDAAHRLAPPGNPTDALRLELVAAFAAGLHGDIERALRIAQRWIDQIPVPGTFEHLVCLMFESLFHLQAGRPADADRALGRTRRLIEQSGKAWIDSLESNYRGQVLMACGQTLEAKAVFEQAVSLGEEGNAQSLHYAHLQLAQVCLETGELRSARSHAMRCLELANAIGTAVHTSPAHQVMADAAWVQGDRHEADRHIRQAILTARRFDLFGQLADSEARQAHYAIAAGEPRLAEPWAARRLEGSLDPADFVRYQEHSVLARYLIVTSRQTAALELIDRLKAAARQDGRARHECEQAILGALALWSRGDRTAALGQFRPALRRASDAQWGAMLARDVPLLEPMLEQSRGTPEIDAFAGALLRNRRDPNHLRIVLDSTGAPLTPREQDMLAGVLTGKSNRELAGEMFITEHTVKRHLSNLYAKLGVTSRAQAIAYFSNRAQ